MLTSLAVIFLVGLFFGIAFEKARLPSLLGMLITGLVVGPHALDLLDDSVLLISPDLRQLALVIILTRAGLSIDVKDLAKVGRPALLMCFLPATFEIAGCLLLAPPLLGLSLLEAGILGTVVAAVSPAVVAPRMIRLMEWGFGRKHSVPQLVLAGASVDDIYVIVLFTSLVAMARGGDFSPAALARVPVAVLTGLAVGGMAGLALSAIFTRQQKRPREMRDSARVVILLGLSFLLLAVEQKLGRYVPFSALLAIMAMGAAMLKHNDALAKRLAAKYAKLWVAAEIVLFVLVGATVDARYALAAGPMALAVIGGAMIFRMAGVAASTAGTALTRRERLFCMIAYTPKATVQAAIGGIPLALGLPCGTMVLTVAVLSILTTAPLGALGIDLAYDRLLTRDGDGGPSASGRFPRGSRVAGSPRRG